MVNNTPNVQRLDVKEKPSIREGFKFDFNIQRFSFLIEILRYKSFFKIL